MEHISSPCIYVETNKNVVVIFVLYVDEIGLMVKSVHTLQGVNSWIQKKFLYERGEIRNLHIKH